MIAEFCTRQIIPLALQGQHRKPSGGISPYDAGEGALLKLWQVTEKLADFSGSHISFPADLACDAATVSAVIIYVYGVTRLDGVAQDVSCVSRILVSLGCCVDRIGQSPATILDWQGEELVFPRKNLPPKDGWGK